jgi:hypothetical protein
MNRILNKCESYFCAVFSPKGILLVKNLKYIFTFSTKVMLYIRVQVWAPGERLATVRRSDNLQLEAKPPDFFIIEPFHFKDRKLPCVIGSSIFRGVSNGVFLHILSCKSCSKMKLLLSPKAFPRNCVWCLNQKYCTVYSWAQTHPSLS